MSNEEITGPLADVFVSEDQIREDEVDREINPEEMYPSQIFSSKFYKLRENEQIEKLVDYLTKDHTINLGIDTELVEEHIEDCAAVRHVQQGDWDIEWTFAKAETEHTEYDEENDEWKDTVKTDHEDGRIFVLLRCNNKECNARLRVDAKPLLEFITKIATEEVDSQ